MWLNLLAEILTIAFDSEFDYISLRRTKYNQNIFQNQKKFYVIM